MKTFTQIRKIEEGAEIYTVKKGSYTRKVDGKTADKMKRQGWKLVAKEDGRQDEQMKKLAAKLKPKLPKLDIKGKLKALGKKITDPVKKLAEESFVLEGKMVWNHKPVISDGTMQMGIFDSDKGKAEEAARQLIFFLRKNKKTKIGESDPEQNDSNADIAKYSEELSKLVFDDKLLDDLEPNGNNSNQSANDIVVGRLRDLGVRIK